MADTCRSCGAPIVFAETVKGRRMPLDRTPDPDGTIWMLDGIARTDQAPSGYPGPFFTTHFVTCPDAKKWRKS